MRPLLIAVHLLLVLAMPVVMVGLVNRTKSWWGGRRGPPITQLAWDLLRLLRKRPVVSQVTTPLFKAGAWVVLAASLLAAMIAPMLGPLAPLQFGRDFIVFAYTLGLARLGLMLSALDTGSPFEGMGSAREASFTAFIEPALFLLVGTAAVVTGQASLADLVGRLAYHDAYAWLVLPVLAVLFVLLQAEAARVPVDDPLTHLELTMVHEVMVLDHSGPELAAMQYAAAVKLTLYAGLIATLLNPFDLLRQPLPAVAAAVALMMGVAVAQGCVESLVARLRMKRVPQYLLLATAVAAAALLAAGAMARAA
ncbi:respiratory chain complex I subunit 1 family protein [Aquabacterium sp.]|uniref:respiratory chain complex I subunit 1 family protein n=1 Tax=Aquabacterium sp. TaxID=1872578 RepID=UPI003783F6BE